MDTKSKKALEEFEDFKLAAMRPHKYENFLPPDVEQAIRDREAAIPARIEQLTLTGILDADVGDQDPGIGLYL